MKACVTVYPPFFAGSLGCKLQGWLCCVLLSRSEIHQHPQRSALRLQLRATVRVLVSNIPQGVVPNPSPPQQANFLHQSIYSCFLWEETVSKVEKEVHLCPASFGHALSKALSCVCCSLRLGRGSWSHSHHRQRDGAGERPTSLLKY